VSLKTRGENRNWHIFPGIPKTMTIVEATRNFEGWLTQQTTVVRAQLSEKHQRMAANPFMFLRGTIYRWSCMWPHVCPDLVRAPPMDDPAAQIHW
jgi:hypothetical protein